MTESDMQHEKRALMLYANSEGLDQPAHMCILIRAFLLVDIFNSIYRICKWITKVPVILQESACRSQYL